MNKQLLLILLQLSCVSCTWHEIYYIDQLSNVAPNGFNKLTLPGKPSMLTDTSKKNLLSSLKKSDKKHSTNTLLSSPEKKNVPLFKTFPALQSSIPWIKLGDLPTPITHLTKLGKILNNNSLYIKRDDLAGMLNRQTGKRAWGGNKVRKLEFILADALAHDAKEILTFGMAGSNFVAAIAAYAHQLGLNCIGMLKPQPYAFCVRNNLLYDLAHNTTLHLYPTVDQRASASVEKFLMMYEKNHRFPYVVPTGGSNIAGTLGFVNAVFELKEQIKQGLMPEPDFIYIACGSYGSAAGLLVGIHAAQLKTKVVAVAIESGEQPQQCIVGIQQLANATNNFLYNLGKKFPKKQWSIDEIIVERNFIGGGYGKFTKEGMHALQQMHQHEEILLDGTYTGKAFAALIHALQHDPAKKNAVILFWNTYTNQDFKQHVAADYKKLPKELHRFFEHDVQQFDWKP